jgi:hypothetical protein
VTKENKKQAKATLKHKTNLAVRPKFFMVPSYLFGTALTCQNSVNCRGDEGGEQWRLEKLGFGENKIKLIMTIG